MTASEKRSRENRYRELIGKEKPLDNFERSGNFSACIVYPNSYEVGMSNLGFQTLYKIINSADNLFCDRAFYDEGLTASGESFESGVSLRDYDLVHITLSFELDYINALMLLRGAEVPLLSEDRDEEDPLVIFGGVVVTANPEPVARFADVIFIGEAEAGFSQFLHKITYSLSIGKTRSLILEETARLNGFYVPQFYRPVYRKNELSEFNPAVSGLSENVKRVYLQNLDIRPSYSSIITDETIFKDMFLVELNRGCPRGCSFCLARTCFKPHRNLSFDKFAEIVSDEIKGRTDRVGLVGTSLVDHPELVNILKYLRDGGFTVGLSSIRGDGLTYEMLSDVYELGQKTITTAPETGDDDLRSVLKKGIVNREFYEFFEMVDEIGFTTLKLYFMLGLGRDLDDEVEAMFDFLDEASRRFTRNIVVSVSPFVPKPHTDFALIETPDVNRMSKLVKRMRKRIFDMGVRDIRVDSIRLSEIQRFLSLGDRRAGDYLISAVEMGKYPKLSRTETDTLPGIDSLLPWGFIDIEDKGYSGN